MRPSRLVAGVCRVTTASPVPQPDSAYHKTFLGQPRQLATLFSVEMWERFSFYGMQGILLIYLYYSIADGGLGLDRVASTSIVGAYGGLVYLSTILGAWLADRIIGAENDAVLRRRAGDVRAHRAVAHPRDHRCRRRPGADRLRQRRREGERDVAGRHPVLRRQDPRRDAGFSIYYFGINLGAFLGPLLTGLLQTNSASTGASAWPRSAWRSV